MLQVFSRISENLILEFLVTVVKLNKLSFFHKTSFYHHVQVDMEKKVKMICDSNFDRFFLRVYVIILIDS